MNERDFERESFDPLGDLSLKRDYWLTAADPEDIAYAVINDNSDLYGFYKFTLCHPIADDLQVAKKIHQLKFCFAEHADPAGLREPHLWDMLRPTARHTFERMLKKRFAKGILEALFGAEEKLAKDPTTALTQLEDVLKQLKERCRKPQRVRIDESADEDRDFDETEDDPWTSVFGEIEQIRKLLPSRTATDNGASQGMLNRWLARLPWRRNAARHEARWADLQRLRQTVTVTIRATMAKIANISWKGCGIASVKSWRSRAIAGRM